MTPDNTLPEGGAPPTISLPIVLPPDPVVDDTRLFELKYSVRYGWVLVPVEDEVAQPKKSSKLCRTLGIPGQGDRAPMKLFALALVSLLAVAAPARADTIVTFGNVTPNQFFAVDNGDGTTTLSTTSSVNITRIIAGALDADALLTFTATSTNDAVADRRHRHQPAVRGHVLADEQRGHVRLPRRHLRRRAGVRRQRRSTGATLTANSSPSRRRSC